MLYRNPLLDGFFRRLQEYPDDIAIRIANKKSTTFADLFYQSEIVVRQLTEQGFSAGNRIAILARPNGDFFAVVIAILRLGGVLVLADPGMGQDVFRSRMASCTPNWVYIEPQIQILWRHPMLRWLIERRGMYIPTIADIPSVRILTTTNFRPSKTPLEAVRQSTKILDSPAFPAEQEQVIIFTSGTTAQPKGVVHTIGSLQHSMELIKSICQFSPLSQVYTSLPYFLLIALASGVSVQSAPLRFSTKQWLKDISQDKPTHIFAAPSEINLVINEYEQKNLMMSPSVRQILLGSAPVTKPVLKLAERRIAPKTLLLGVYGLTEMLPVAVVDGREKIRSLIPGDLLGQLLPGIKAKSAPDGELLLSAQHMSPHYLGQAPTEWVSTGDIVIIKDQQLVLIGRKKDMIIRGNYNIYPRLYESTIEGMPGVAACAMIGVWDKQKNDERIVLVVEPHHQYKKDIVRRIWKYLKQPEYTIDQAAWPDEIVAMTLPRSGRQSKIDKQKLLKIIMTRP